MWGAFDQFDVFGPVHNYGDASLEYDNVDVPF